VSECSKSQGISEKLGSMETLNHSPVELCSTVHAAVVVAP
jgi:hypothetical protein